MKRSSPTSPTQSAGPKSPKSLKDCDFPNFQEALEFVSDNESSNGRGRRFDLMDPLGTEVLEKVAIIDFGAQYGKVIDRRVRECNVLCDLLPYSTSFRELISKGYSAVIITGGPNSVYEVNAPMVDFDIFNGQLPVLGICYGFQLINKFFGGTVSSQKLREDGQTTIEIENGCALFTGLDSTQRVLLTHGDGLTEETVAPGFKVIARSGQLVAGIANEQKKIFGIQFHPEVDLTEHGTEIFKAFLHDIAGLKCTYTMENREKICIDMIRKTVLDKNVLVMVSGGVDSAVCAALLNRALGAEHVIAIHIDNGFMRENESEEVIDSLKNIGLEPKRCNFINAFLTGSFSYNGVESRSMNEIVEPEEKRMIIGDTFIKCKDIAAAKLGLDKDIFLAQGTLRPDLIESASEIASKCADVIKTHHNDTLLVRQLRDLGRVIEPLKDFHKDEVRELGVTLGLPDSIVRRHPFPGPGLAIRILCATEPFKEEHFDEDKKLIAEITNELSKDIKSTLLPIKSVGVQGDKRTYSYVAALSSDLPPEEIDWHVLRRLAQELPSRVHTINRVVFIFGKAIQQDVDDVTVTRINEGTLQQLRQADNIVTNVLRGLDEKGQPDSQLEDIMMSVQQLPVISVPIHFDRVTMPPKTFPSVCRSICLRPFITKDFMTGRPAIPTIDIPLKSILEMFKRIKDDVPMISRVMIDLTSKPPGTTEWE